MARYGFLLLFPLVACAAPYATPEFDFSQLDGGTKGFVERISHTADPAGDGRVRVRLDNGFTVDAGAGGESFEPGERVRIHKTSGKPRAERE